MYSMYPFSQKNKPQREVILFRYCNSQLFWDWTQEISLLYRYFASIVSSGYFIIAFKIIFKCWNKKIFIYTIFFCQCLNFVVLTNYQVLPENDVNFNKFYLTMSSIFPKVRSHLQWRHQHLNFFWENGGGARYILGGAKVKNVPKARRKMCAFWAENALKYAVLNKLARVVWNCSKICCFRLKWYKKDKLHTDIKILKFGTFFLGKFPQHPLGAATAHLAG